MKFFKFAGFYTYFRYTINNHPEYNSNYGCITNSSYLTNRKPIESFVNAIKVNNIKSIKRMLDNNPDFVKSKLHGGETALFTAISWNRQDVIELLVTKGADVNISTSSGWKPLYQAVSMNKSNLETVKLLIRNGAKVDSHALKLARRKNQNEIYSYMLKVMEKQ